MTLYEDLKWRGLIQDISDEKLIDKETHSYQFITRDNGQLKFRRSV